MNVSQIRKLVSTFSTVGNEMGINPQTLNRDVADIFAGKNVQRTSLGMQLGLTNKDIENAKASAQGLYGFLEDRLSGYAEANENFKNTIEGSWQHLEGVATLASSTISSAFEPAIAAAMNAVANFFGTIEENKETGEEAFKPSPYTYELLDVLIRLGTYIASVIDWVIYAATSMEEWYSSITGGCDILDDMCTVLESVISFVVYSITIFAGFGLIVLRVAAWCGSAFPRIADLIRAVVASINAVITAAKEMWAALHGDAASVVSLDIKRREYVNQANKLSEEAINYDPTSTKNDTMGSSGGGKLTNEFRAFIADFKAKLGAPSKKSSINPDDIQSRFPPAEKEDNAKKKAAKEALQEAKRHYEEQKEALKNALEDIKEQIKKDLDHLDALNEQGLLAVSTYYQRKEALEAKQAQADVDYYQKLIALTQATPYEHETDKQKELLKLQRSLDKATDQLGEINKTANYIKDISQENKDNFGYLLGTQSNLIKDSGVQINNEGSQSVSQSVSQSDSGDPFKVTGKTNEELAYRFFTNKAIGFNDNFARGIIGALMGETEGLNPKDPGGGIQQLDSYRWGQLVKFANDNHSDVYSIYTQLANLVREITTGDEAGSWKEALELIKAAGGTAEAVTRYYTEKVLRPQDHNQGIIRANTKIPILNNILADANKNPQPQSQVTTTSPQSSANMYAGKPAYLVQGDMYGLDSRYVASNHPRG